MPKCFILDPDFDSINGVIVGGSKVLPLNQHDLSGIAKYIRSTGKAFAQLTPAEIEGFKFPKDSYTAKEA